MDPYPKPPKKPDSFILQPYSKSFQDLVATESRLRELMEGSYVPSDPTDPDPWDKDEAFKTWEHGRRFISQTINNDGSLLDYGCANGFLLRCLQEWSSHQLNPYGTDID